MQPPAHQSQTNSASSQKQMQVEVETEKCPVHGEEVILLCLKDSEHICARCLHSTHLLHPVVPLGSLDQLDF